MPDNLQEWQQAKAFVQLLDETFAGLKQIKPGSDHSLRATKMFKEYGEDYIIDACKMFIDQNRDYELSNDYKKIKHLKVA